MQAAHLTIAAAAKRVGKTAGLAILALQMQPKSLQFIHLRSGEV
jgi:hypothetical protein